MTHKGGQLGFYSLRRFFQFWGSFFYLLGSRDNFAKILMDESCFKNLLNFNTPRFVPFAEFATWFWQAAWKSFRLTPMACRGLWMEVAWLKLLLSSRGRAICCKHIPKWSDLKVTKPNDLKKPKGWGGSIYLLDFFQITHTLTQGKITLLTCARLGILRMYQHDSRSIGWGLSHSHIPCLLTGRRASPIGRQVHVGLFRLVWCWVDQ